MDLQQLRYIVALSKELNFQRAAKSVGISQPTLSQQIKKLENELGEPLFERSPHRVGLTPAGSQFIPRALNVLETLNSGVKEIREGREKLAGKVTLAFIPTIGPYLLPPLLKTIRRLAPKITLELYEETTSVLVEHLKSGKFDVGILALPIIDPGIVSRSLGREEFYLAVPKKHPLASKKKVRANNLSSEKLLVLQEGHCFRDQALEFCQKYRTNPQIIFEGSSLVSVMNLASAGEGITFVPKMAVKKGIYSELKFIPFSSPKPQREIGAIWRMTSLPSHGQRFIMGIIENILKGRKT